MYDGKRNNSRLNDNQSQTHVSVSKICVPLLDEILSSDTNHQFLTIQVQS